MKNYYDELEVSKTASKEVIEKVYKFLAKKYHPDTTKESDNQAAEEKFKIISEAYQILSDDEERKKYDLELKQNTPTVPYEEYINVVNQRDYLNTSLIKLKNEYNQYRNSSTTRQYHNNYQNITQNNSTSNCNTTSQKKSYHYDSTIKPASIFSCFVGKIRNLFSNIGLLLLSIIVAILILNIFSNFNFFSLFIK